MNPAVEAARDHLLAVQRLTDPCGCAQCDVLVADATRALADEVAVAHLLTPIRREDC
jgi:hypothetical protein